MRGPFGYTQDDVDPGNQHRSAANDTKPQETPKLVLLEKKYGYQTLRNNSASGSQGSSRSSGGSDSFKINFSMTKQEREESIR